MRRSTLGIALLMCLLATCAPAFDENTYPQPTSATSSDATKPALVVFTGKVLSDGAAVSGAVLRAGQASTTSDSNGGFRLELPTGSHKLQISANGHAPLSLQLSLTADTELTIELNPASTLTVVAGETSADPSVQVNAVTDLVIAGPGLPARLWRHYRCRMNWSLRRGSSAYERLLMRGSLLRIVQEVKDARGSRQIAISNWQLAKPISRV